MLKIQPFYPHLLQDKLITLKSSRNYICSDINHVSSFFAPQQTRSLVDLKLSGNPWKCDCGSLGWIRDWLKDVKSKSASSFMSTINYGGNSNSNNNRSVSEEEERVEQVLSQLRDGECYKNRRSLLESFRKELRDCRRNTSSTPSPSYFTILFSFLLLTLQRIREVILT